MAEKTNVAREKKIPRAKKEGAKPKLAKATKTGETETKPGQIFTGRIQATGAVPSTSTLIAIVRVRGLTGMHPRRKDTLLMLNLKRSNQATLIHKNASYEGMLFEGKDYIAWGPISKNALVKMLAKRAEIGSKALCDLKKPEEIVKLADELLAGKSLKELGINRSIRLAPPSGGWKSRKKNLPYGDLGPHESMDATVLKMI